MTLADGTTLAADHLLLATGAAVNFFGVSGAAQHAFPLYTGADAARIKAQLERLVTAGDPFSIVVVGAGDTGVEVTGALLDVLEFALPRAFPNFSRDRAISTWWTTARRRWPTCPPGVSATPTISSRPPACTSTWARQSPRSMPQASCSTARPGWTARWSSGPAVSP